MTSAHHDLDLDIFDESIQKRFFEGRLTLCVDAQGSWDVDQAVDMSDRLSRIGVSCLEQPVDDYSHYQALSDLIHMPMMTDESVVTLEDAEYLVRNDPVDFFNILINKNGGLLAAIRVAELADKWDQGFQLGATYSEMEILASAGLQFLQIVTKNSLTEICYGEKTLKKDLVDENIKFSFGGKLPVAVGPGLGINVNPKQLSRFLICEAIKIDLA